MDPNLQYWQTNGQSFLSRLRLWFNILDPRYVLSSQAEIKEARILLEKEGNKQRNEKVANAWLLSLSSVHADTGAVISPVFRPQGFLPISGPLVVASLIPHKGIKPALFWQFLLQAYCAGFNHSNRNATATKDNTTSLKQSILMVGTVSYSTFAGALPQIILQRFRPFSAVIETICRSLLPIPLSACLAAFSVMVVRSEESDNGIQVFDSNGNAVGVSKEAGSKAIKETAISRAALFGTTAAAPSFLLALLKRAKFVQRNPMIIAPVRHVSTAIIFGLMIPVSFSLFPQFGKIKRENLEEEFRSLESNRELFYHRGL
ncbi:sideroflexin-4 isoform X1 [Pimephales promelas]|uniref:sideroflexin-4 isoform X1 n=1 Tax=Pimephales promelas TaxID=90988 RepID=UPI00195583B3|nr:sideroflexin-4 isoform X1 [Pimephales promelas]KAG1950860.1 sideroflexin-4 [Pimephales promelas]